MSQNTLQNGSRYTRFPASRVFIEDLEEGNWNFEENMLETRYGKLKRVRICATVINKKEVIEEGQEDTFLVDDTGTNSRISFQIDDGTGRLWATLWNIDIDNYSGIKKGISVDAVGIVRIYNNKIQVTLDYIRNLRSPNFETYHRIDVIRRRKFEPKFEITKSTSKMDDEFSLDYDIPDDDLGFGEPEDDFDKGSLMEDDDTSSEILNTNSFEEKNNNQESDPFEMIELEDQVKNFIKENDREEGVSRNEILNNFSIDDSKIDEIIEKLLQEVEIYKTQANHYSSY